MGATLENINITVDLCCNDPDNGLFNNKLEMINIGSNLSFCAKYRPAALAFNDDRLRLSGKYFNILGHNYWVGNWCWDSVLMKGSAIIELLNWPRFRQMFTIDEGEHRLFRFWENNITWQDDHLRLIAKNFE